MARAVRFHQHGGPEVLRIETVDVAPPAKGEVQIRVRALGLNRAEALLRRGTYIETATFPSGLGLEAAGLVAAIGEDVAGIVPGDAVSIVPPLSMVRWPAYAELATLVRSPIIELNRAVAIGMAEGPAAALALVDQLTHEPALKNYHLLPSVRGDLLFRLDRFAEARAAFEIAAILAGNKREHALLKRRATDAADAANQPLICE